MVFFSHPLIFYILVIFFHCNSIFLFQLILLYLFYKRFLNFDFVKKKLKMDFQSHIIHPYCVWSLLSNNVKVQL